jgi:hypothetical protein
LAAVFADTMIAISGFQSEKSAFEWLSLPQLPGMFNSDEIFSSALFQPLANHSPDRNLSGSCELVLISGLAARNYDSIVHTENPPSTPDFRFYHYNRYGGKVKARLAIY